MEKSKVLFWNVDTQKDFVNPDGALYVQDAEVIKTALQKLTNLAREEEIKVINTADWHYDNSEELSENPDFVNTFPPHCMAKTDGASYIEETQPENPSYINWDESQTWIETFPAQLPESIISNREIVITKDKFDVFTGNPYTNEVTRLLKKQGYTTVVVYGVATNVCVNCAVLGLLERGFEVVVAKDAIMGLPGIPSPVGDWVEKGVEMLNLTEIKEIWK